MPTTDLPTKTFVVTYRADYNPGTGTFAAVTAPDAVQAAYYRIEGGWVHFKDDDNQFVLSVTEAAVQSIRIKTD